MAREGERRDWYADGVLVPVCSVGRRLENAAWHRAVTGDSREWYQARCFYAAPGAPSVRARSHAGMCRTGRSPDARARRSERFSRPEDLARHQGPRGLGDMPPCDKFRLRRSGGRSIRKPDQTGITPCNRALVLAFSCGFASDTDRRAAHTYVSRPSPGCREAVGAGDSGAR